MTSIRTSLEKLNNLIYIQSLDGNWNYSEYMFGLMNGLLVARSCFTNESPRFYDRPRVYISDLSLTDSELDNIVKLCHTGK